MANNSLVLSIPLSLPHLFYLIPGTCQQFTLSYPPMGAYSCPGSNITYTCVLCSTLRGVTTVWTGSAVQCPSTGSQVANQLSLYQKSNGVVYPTATESCGNLSAVTTNVSTDGYCYTSVLTIPAVQGLNGTTVMCVDGFTGAMVGNDTLMVTIVGESCAIVQIIRLKYTVGFLFKSLDSTQSPCINIGSEKCKALRTDKVI